MVEIKAIATGVDGICSSIIEFLTGLFFILAYLFAFIVQVLLIFVPIKQIAHAISGQYLDAQEIERLTGNDIGRGGYWRKKDIREFEAELEKELKNENNVARIC
jgi:hypothetical protein